MSQKTKDVILRAFLHVAEDGMKKVSLESETHSVTAYKVGLVVRIDVKEKHKEEK